MDPGDQAALLGHAAQALATGHLGPVMSSCPPGPRRGMLPAPARAGPGAARRRLHVKLIELAGKLAPTTLSLPRRLLPGLGVGSGPLWLRGCDQVDAAYASGEWLALEGEFGSRQAGAAAGCPRRRNPAGTFHVLEAAGAGGHDWLVPALSELLDGEGSLVIRHVPTGSAPGGCTRCG